MSYYLNLSVLSNTHNNLCKAERQKLLTTEARRVLSLCEGGPVTEDDIAREENGRPFFLNKKDGTDFNVSHSGNLAVVSYVKGENTRTGCDVELVRPRAMAKKIAEEFFTAQERNYIESEGRFDEIRFYQIWTLKECFLKLKGLSVFDIHDAPSFSFGGEPQVLGKGILSPIFFNLYELKGGGEHYILASAVEGKEECQPEIRWFSDESLSCKIIAKIKAEPNPAQTVSPKI